MVDAATLSDLSKWLAATSLSHTIQTTGWIIPALQTIHILCVAVLFSAAVLVDLRIWRLLQPRCADARCGEAISSADLAGRAGPFGHRKLADRR
jgi:hypothetical protein